MKSVRFFEENMWQFILLCFTALLVNFVKSDGLDNFVLGNVVKYSEWLKEKNLDPTPVIAGPSVFRRANILFSIDTYISNFAMKGHSGRIEVNHIETDLSKQMFTVNLTISNNVTFYGEYTANGTSPIGQPLNGSGVFHVNAPSLFHGLFSLEFDSSPNGNLRVSSYDLFSIELKGVNVSQDVYFEGLLEHESSIGFEGYIISLVYNGFSSFVNSTGGQDLFPIRSLYLQYWEAVLAETTMADIIDATVPPSTTTPDPCQSRQAREGEEFEYFGNGEVLEKVVENEDSIDADGIPVVIRKTTFVTRERKEL